MLTLGTRPSLGLNFLVDSGWIKNFKGLEALTECPQNENHHPEGNAWVHTCLVADSAAWARDKVDPEWQEAYVFGAFLHDIGKPATTITQE